MNLEQRWECKIICGWVDGGAEKVWEFGVGSGECLCSSFSREDVPRKTLEVREELGDDANLLEWPM